VIDIFIDGGSRGNPGEGAISYIVFDSNRELCRFGKKIGRCTNNFAEYSALIEALRYITKNQSGLKDRKRITIYSDSQLLVNQMNGIYKIRSKNIKILVDKAKSLTKKLENVKIVNIPREKNKKADKIVNMVLDQKSYRPANRSQDLFIPEESPGS